MVAHEFRHTPHGAEARRASCLHSSYFMLLHPPSRRSRKQSRSGDICVSGAGRLTDAHNYDEDRWRFLQFCSSCHQIMWHPVNIGHHQIIPAVCVRPRKLGTPHTVPRPEQHHVRTHHISCCCTPLEEITKIISLGGHMHKRGGQTDQCP